MAATANNIDEYSDKQLALAQHLECEPDDISESTHDDCAFEAGMGKYPPEYRVLTDSEADVEWDDALDSYIDECLEIPEPVASYFDRDAWKRDARMDGRGHSLNHYDGSEWDEQVNGETYYIYRTN